ncbi:hypothetical protein QOT17_020825 [Balamuthia mandrillaris]
MYLKGGPSIFDIPKRRLAPIRCTHATVTLVEVWGKTFGKSKQALRNEANDLLVAGSSEPDDWQKGHLFHSGKGRVPLLTTPSLPSTAQQHLLPPSSPLPCLSPTPSIPSSFLTLRDSDAEMPVYPLGATREDRVSVIVLWRESITLTPETLENVLKGCPASTEVVYIHLDLVFWRPVLQQAEELQLRYPNLKIMTLSRWEDRQTTYRKGLERVNSRWVLFHDNNNLNTEKNMLDKLVRAFKTTSPPPVILAPLVGAVAEIGQKQALDHHAVMKVSLVDPTLLGRSADVDDRPLFHWGGWEGIPLANSAGLKVLSGPMIELHSYMIDAGRLDEGYQAFNPDCAFAAYHACVGLAMYKQFGEGASAVLANASFDYVYPVAHLQLMDIPLTTGRWNPWDCLRSISYLEYVYNVVYFHQCGWDWHIRMAFYKAEFVGTPEEPLSKDPVLITALLHSMYVLNHLTHALVLRPAVPLPSHEEQEALNALYSRGEEAGWMPPRDFLFWLSTNADLLQQFGEEDDEDNAILHLSALMEQRSVPPFSQTTTNENDDVESTRAWLRESIPFITRQEEIPKEKWLFETAKHDNIHWCLQTYGFLWVQADLPPAIHRKWQHKSVAVLHSKRWNVYRYLLLVEGEMVSIKRVAGEEAELAAFARERHRGDPSLFQASLFWTAERDRLMRTLCFDAGLARWLACPHDGAAGVGLPLMSRGFSLVKWGKRSGGEHAMRYVNGGGWPIKRIADIVEGDEEEAEAPR